MVGIQRVPHKTKTNTLTNYPRASGRSSALGLQIVSKRNLLGHLTAAYSQNRDTSADAFRPSKYGHKTVTVAAPRSEHCLPLRPVSLSFSPVHDATASKSGPRSELCRLRGSGETLLVQ